MSVARPVNQPTNPEEKNLRSAGRISRESNSWVAIEESKKDLIKMQGELILKGAKQWESHACIRCGRCIDSCPYGLNPSELSITCEAKEFALALENNVMECKECGCCTYVCPAKRPIVHLIKFAKAEIAKQTAQRTVQSQQK